LTAHKPKELTLRGLILGRRLFRNLGAGAPGFD